VELSLGILTSAFCVDADGITLGWAEEDFGLEKRGPSQLVRYYLTGDGENPALAHIDTAQRRISSCLQWVENYKAEVERACPQWQAWAMNQNLVAVEGSLNQSKALLLPANIYPYYHQTVHNIVCGSTVSGLGWLVIFQAMLGLICLPALACTASCLLESLMTERRMGHGFDLLQQDEQEDIEDWNQPSLR